MLRNKKLSRLLSLIAAFSVLFTAFAGINVSAEVPGVTNQSFYEDFEGYSNASYSSYNGSKYNDWEMRNVAGTWSNVTQMNVSVVEGAFEGGKAIEISRTLNSGTSTTTALNRNPEITIGTEDIIISGDVYIPAIDTTDTDQRVRFYVARGNSATDVAAADGWPAYKPLISPAFGLFFTGNGEKWNLQIGTGTKQNSYHGVSTTETNGFEVTGEKWYNLCYVYHPVTGEVDYYIDGEFLVSHPIDLKVGDTEDTFVIPTLEVGGALGNINLSTGGNGGDAEAMFDNISVVKASAASDAKYAEVEKGTQYVFANWDIPVDKATVAEANVKVYKMADGDITFSGDGKTEATGYDVVYTGSNGVGIKFDSALNTAYERYQVVVTGLKDVYAYTNVTRKYSFVVKDGMVQKGTPYSESFDTADVIDGTTNWSATSTKWGSNNTTTWAVSYDADAKALKASGTAASYQHVESPLDFNLPVNDTVEYVDINFDLKATTTGTDIQIPILFKDSRSSGNPWHTGIVLEEDVVYSAASNRNYVRNYVTKYDNINGAWKSYKLRYYPYEGKLEVYMGDAQDALALVLTANTLYTSASGGTGTGELKWDNETHGDEITGLLIRQNSANLDILLDNVSGASYGYSQPYSARASFSDNFNAGAGNWEAKNVNGQTASFEVADEKLKIATGTTAYGQIRTSSSYGTTNKPVVNVPINDMVNYVDADFKIKGDNGTGSGWNVYICLTEANGDQRHTGVVLSETEVKPFSRTGKSLTAYTVAISNIIGTEQNCRLRYYPEEGKIEFYMNDFATPVLTSLTYADRAADNKSGATHITWDTVTHGSGIGGFSIQTGAANTITYLDDLSITSYSKVIDKAVTFEDGNGAVVDGAAGAKTIKLHLANATAAPAVTLDGTALNGTLTNGVYTASRDTMLIGDTEYTLNIGDMAYTFTTGAGKFVPSNLRFEKDGEQPVLTLNADDVITAKVDATNSKKDAQTPYLVWAAYEGNQLKAIDFVKLSAVSGADGVTLTADEALTVTSEYTTVKAFLWDGLDTIVPLMKEATVTRAN